MAIKDKLTKLFGDPQKKDLKRIWKIVEEIKQIEERFHHELTNEDIPHKTAEFRRLVEQGVELDDLLPEAFALVKFACRRLIGKSWNVRGQKYTWDMIPYDVQLAGAIVLHEGKIAEMRTGEGKTLACTMPLFLNSLSGKGAHVVTVNDYLAQRDAEWMSGLYRFLGLTVGVSLRGQTLEEKKAAYAADITYGTNNELGFDFLRNSMAPDENHLIQKKPHYAIVDEVDSILIDEARTPLVMSKTSEESTDKYLRYSHLVTQLEENAHFNVDEKMRLATLTEEGVKKMEELLGVDNIYTAHGYEEVHHIEQALRANYVYKRDIDYVVKDNQVIIVDEFTGRLMPGRRLGAGLHQAVEAKERVEIKRESKTIASITFQNYFRMFEKLAGMTGTAKTEEEEFIAIYGLPVIEIPTNEPVIRDDKQDAIYKHEPAKFQAITKKVKELNAKGQPVLIGTVSVEKSEALSEALKQGGVPHQVLNAKHHEKEAEIIANAGQKGSITIATSMAGRGTDIKLGEGVVELGGLYIIGSERHESRRIDNQLRGRSGRQGDPGTSQFYVSMEDTLMRIFGGGRMQAMMERLGLPDDMPIENKFISRSIESAQKKVEGRNFDIRKHLVQYDDVLNTHRDIIYHKRVKVMEGENLKNEILKVIEQEAEKIVLNHTSQSEGKARKKGQTPVQETDLQEIFEVVSAIHKSPVEPLAMESLAGLSQEELIEKIKNYLQQEYLKKEASLPNPDLLRHAEKLISLKVLDTFWENHIDELRQIREAVSFSGYGQRNPLVEYKNHAFVEFEKMMDKADRAILQSLFRIKVQAKAPQATSAPAPQPNPTVNQPAQATSSISYSNSNTNESENNTAKIGRNDPCPCGSGKKYKKCHG
jgi:preprotein translocase subunit SecA